MTLLRGLSIGLFLVVCATDAGAKMNPVTRTGDYSLQQTDTVLWTPATGNRIWLAGCVLSKDATAATVQIESANIDVIPPLYMQANTTESILAGAAPFLWRGDANATLTVTTSAGGSVSVLCWGMED